MDLSYGGRCRICDAVIEFPGLTKNACLLCNSQIKNNCTIHWLDDCDFCNRGTNMHYVPDPNEDRYRNAIIYMFMGVALVIYFMVFG